MVDSGDINPTRNDYEVLTLLYNDETTKLNALTKKYIMKATKLSINKISESLNLFIKLGYVDEGISKGRAKTYYLTEQGVKNLEDVARIV